MVVAPVSDNGCSSAHASREGLTVAIPFHRFVVARLALTALAYVALVGGMGDASAMGLGQATVLSSLGQPLRLSLPVTVQADEEVGCVQVRPSSDDLPSVFNVRTQVTRVGSQTRIEITSAQSIDEPALGLRVSVGCASPVSRDVVVFLDPPSIAPPVVAATTALAPTPIRPRARSAPAPVRREGAAPRRAPTAQSGSGRSTADALPRRARQPATRTPRAAVTTQPALPRLVDTPKEADAAARAKAERDRLTVAPTEASKVPPLPSMATPAPTPAPADAKPATPPTAVAPAPPADATSTAPTIVPAEATPDEIAAREAQLKRDQAQLQERIKALSDQIAALRVQTTTLVARNQELETSALAPWLVWLLIGLALIGIVVAGWMTYRYMHLRRALEGSPWWGGNTVYAPVAEDPPPAPSPAAPTAARPPSNAGLTLGSRTSRTDVRSNVTSGAAPSTNTSNVQGRSRPTSRDPRYATSIDTDFTVSDIEAAMATVRTVSPPRSQPPQNFTESDFAAVSAPGLPSPFAESSATTSKVDERSIDLDIPPIPPSTDHAAASIASNAWTSPKGAPVPPKPVEPVVDEPPLDFKLDLPETEFDPLSTDSMKTTIVDRATAPPDDLTISSVPALDFELPPATHVAPLGAHERTEFDVPVRHGATALDNLFDATMPMGPDTILNLDERDDSPLSSTEVDRLVTTEFGAEDRIEGTLHARLGRFGDVITQVDEIATTEPTRAISKLRQYVLRDERIPTLFWLRLFALYRQVGKEAVYGALGEHFSRRYHRPPPVWDGELADRAPQTPLTAMKAIDKAIEDQWGTEAGLESIRALLCDRDQPDAIVFDAVLQRDLLDAAKVFPPPEATSAS